jgi:hypothetical protein
MKAMLHKAKKCIIKELYDLPVLLEFENDNIRPEIVSQSKNPLDLVYIVDLICTSKRRPSKKVQNNKNSCNS